MPVTEVLLPVTDRPAVITENVIKSYRPPPPVVEAPVEAAPIVVPESVVAETKPEEPKKDVKFGQRFAELSRRQRDQVQKEMELKEREAKLAPIAEKLAKSKGDPTAALEALGMTYEEITDFYLREGEEPEVSTEATVEALVDKKLEERLEAEKAAKETVRLAKEAEDKKALDVKVEVAIAQRKSELAAHAEAAPDKYELTIASGQIDLAWDVTDGWWAAHGEMLTVEQALDKVEAHLEAETAKLLNSKKFKKQPEETPVVEPEPQRERAPTRASTLSNKIQTSQAPAAERPKLSREESRKRAASLLRFK